MDQQPRQPALPPAIAAGEAARPGRLRLALAARERREDLLARRAERLARIRAEADTARIRAEAGTARIRAEADTARIRAEAGAAMAAPVTVPMAFSAATGGNTDAEADALERFLAGLAGTVETGPVPPQPARLSPAVVPLARRMPPADPMPGRMPDRVSGPSAYADGIGAGAEGLSRLPGAGPGLVGALIRAGVPDLAALAALARADLAERLGPIARLIDLDAWIAFAQSEADPDLPAPDLPAAG